MARTRTYLKITAVAALLLAAGVFFVWTNLDWIVKNAIERYGSRATGTAVRVGRVSLRPAQGIGSITDLTVANPPGFTAPHILSLGGIGIRIAPRAIASDPLVIDDIQIAAPLVVYEMNDDRTANSDVLTRRMSGNGPAKAGKKPDSDGKKLRIKRLVIEAAKVDVRVAALGDRPRVLTLARLEMNDIGGRNGASPEQVARQIVTAILARASKEAGKAGATRLLEKGLERALKRKK